MNGERYENQKRSLMKRLLANCSVNMATNCWEWTGKSKTTCGYGVLGSKIENRNHVYAHRASWIVFRGPLPEASVICHSCDNPTCFNPDHLWIGTQTDNLLDKLFKGRQGNIPNLIEKRIEEIRNLLEKIGLHEQHITEVVRLITKN